MKKDDAEEYTQSLGQIVAGSWRQIALAQRLGVPKALGMQLDDWVRDRLGGYVRMTIEERREAVLQLTEEGYSNREVAGVLGVGETTVRRDQAPPNGATFPDGRNGINDLSNDDAPNGAPSADDDDDFDRESERNKREFDRRSEMNERETILRVARYAYWYSIAWANADFQSGVKERLKDPEFRRAMIERVRADPEDIDKIEEGARIFADLLVDLIGGGV